jgi:hypothetical protein
MAACYNEMTEVVAWMLSHGTNPNDVPVEPQQPEDPLMRNYEPAHRVRFICSICICFLCRWLTQLYVSESWY